MCFDGMVTSRPFTCAAVACLVALIGCSTVPPVVPFFGTQSRIRDEGYSLLYALADKQSNVGKILVIKSASAKVSAEIKQIAEVFSQAKKQLDGFLKDDGSLNFKMSHLPTMEEKTRAAIESTTTKDLLFSSGKAFELRLLLTQVEALDYASHLANQLANQDGNPKRKEFLTQFAKQCEQHHKQVVDLLASL
jgi:hypothetical protein